jgi:hypothetical protein
MVPLNLPVTILNFDQSMSPTMHRIVEINKRNNFQHWGIDCNLER